jgi:hypothetical protein
MDKALDILKRADGTAADQALTAGLAAADPSSARAIAQALLARKTRESLPGLLSCWHRLDEPLREQVLTSAEGLFNALSEVVTRPDEQARANAIEVIRAGRLYRAAYLLDAGLRDRSPSIRERSAGALQDLAETILTRPADPEPAGDEPPEPASIPARMAEVAKGHEDRRQLAAAVESGLADFDIHRQPAVVRAAMWLIDDVPATRCWKVLTASNSRASRAALAILGEPPDPRLVPFMIQSLHYAEFRAAVAAILASCTDREFLAEWFRQSWRFVQPKPTRGLAAVHELASFKRQLVDIVTLPDDAQAHVPRCASAMGLPELLKVGLLRELYRRGRSAGRRAAVWALTGLTGEPRAVSALRAIAAEGDAESAWVAACELARLRLPDYPIDALAARLSQPPAEEPPGPRPPATPLEYWNAFERLSDDDRLRWGRRLLGEPRIAEPLIRAWLASSAMDERLRALKLVTLLDMARLFEARICQMCYDPSPEVRSAAAAALGDVPTAASRRVLSVTLYDADSRVQANSVESLERVAGASAASDLIPKLASTDNRTRANAVRALLKLGVREAAETLLAMLEDENRAHRASGLWLVEQMGLFPLAERVLRMADTDEDEQVRKRARAIADTLGAHDRQPTAPAEPREVPV